MGLTTLTITVATGRVVLDNMKLKNGTTRNITIGEYEAAEDGEPHDFYFMGGLRGGRVFEGHWCTCCSNINLWKVEVDIDTKEANKKTKLKLGGSQVGEVKLF